MRRTPPEIAEFDDVHQDADGTWHATHTSGWKIASPSWEGLEADAVAVRVVEGWRRAWA